MFAFHKNSESSDKKVIFISNKSLVTKDDLALATLKECPFISSFSWGDESILCDTLWMVSEELSLFCSTSKLISDKYVFALVCSEELVRDGQAFFVGKVIDFKQYLILKQASPESDTTREGEEYE